VAVLTLINYIDGARLCVCGGGEDDWQVLMRAAVWQSQVLMEMRP